MNFLKNLLASSLFTTTDRRIDYLLGFVVMLLIIVYKLNKASLLQV